MKYSVIEIIPFDNVHDMNLLLKKNEKESTQIIDHRVVVYKRVRHGYDDRI